MNEKVSIARLLNRPSALDFISYIFTDFVELHGDRCFRDDPAVVGGIAWLDNRAVTVIGIQKGCCTEENIKRNFGSPHPEGYRKALRLMLQAEKFNRPVINFINTAGAFCGIGAEERGQGQAIAQNLVSMAALQIPIISIIIGEGGSGGALALAVANSVWMLENSIYSILSPEGFASILWKDSSRANEAAELMKITAPELLALGVIEKIIPEGDACTNVNFEFCGNYLKNCLIDELNILCSKNAVVLVEDRYMKFRKYGAFFEE